MSAMFVLFWRVSGSGRIAGIGVAVFTGNFNFLFWSAQFSYQSLALPLLLLVLLAAVEAGTGSASSQGRLAGPGRSGDRRRGVTHHVTTYAVVAS